MSELTPLFEIAKLGEHTEILAGPPFNSAMFTDKPEDIPLVKGENVQQGYVDWNIAKHWPVNDAETYKRYRLVPGDVVVAMDRPWVTAGIKWAYIRREDPPALLVQRVARLRAKKTLDQSFLRCLISSSYFSNYIQPIVTGVNVPHISGKQIADFRIPVPKLETQKKIAAILSAYDDLIANNQRRITLLERMAEDIYREWFVRLRFPGHEKAKIEKGVPLGWAKRRFGDFCVLKRGYDLPDADIQDGVYPVIASTSIKAFHNQYKVEPPVITTGRSGSLGQVLFVNTKAWPLNTALYVRDFCGNSAYLVFYVLKNMELEKFNAGAGVPSLNRNHLSGVPIVVPPSQLQKAFDLQLEPLWAQKDLLNCQISKLAEMRDALLPRLISGKLAVDALDIRFPPSFEDTFAPK
jgi:type I restriction enzyme, S subunit